MSQQEVHIGKARRIKRYANKWNRRINADKVDRVSVEEWCEDYCKRKNISHVRSFCDSWEGTLLFVLGEKFIIVDDEIYKVIEDKCLEGQDIFEATENNDGTIDYCLSFYNGGCGFSEALEEAIQDMTNRKGESIHEKI